MLSSKRFRGFSVIELMVVVAIVGLLAAAATPSFVRMIGNAKVRAVTDSLQNGLRLAQAEAVRRQRVMVFIRRDTAACELGVAAAGGNHWVVFTLPERSIVQCGSSAETGSGMTVAGPAAICFGVEGRQQAVTKDDVGAAMNAECTVEAAHALDVNSASGDRKLRVRVTSAGSVRLCDIDKAFSATTPDGCPAT